MNSTHRDGCDPHDLDATRWIGARMMIGGLITAVCVLLSLFSLFTIAEYGAIFVIPCLAGVVAGILVFRSGVRRWRKDMK